MRHAQHGAPAMSAPITVAHKRTPCQDFAYNRTLARVAYSRTRAPVLRVRSLDSLGRSRLEYLTPPPAYVAEVSGAMGHGNPRFRAHLGSCRHSGAGKPRFPRTWTAPVATRHGNPKFQRQTRQAVSTPPRNGNPEFARLGRFFIVPQHGNREFHKLWRFRSRCDMETQVPGGRWRPQRFPELGSFPHATKQKAPGFRGLGRFSVVPRHGNPSSLHRGRGFRHATEWKAPCSVDLGGRSLPRDGMETRSSPNLGGRSLSRVDMET